MYTKMSSLSTQHSVTELVIRDNGCMDNNIIAYRNVILCIQDNMNMFQPGTRQYHFMKETLKDVDRAYQSCLVNKRLFYEKNGIKTTYKRKRSDGTLETVKRSPEYLEKQYKKKKSSKS